MITTGGSLIVTHTLAVAVHPDAFVTVTEYVPADETVMHCELEPLLQ